MIFLNIPSQRHLNHEALVDRIYYCSEVLLDISIIYDKHFIDNNLSSYYIEKTFGSKQVIKKISAKDNV